MMSTIISILVGVLLFLCFYIIVLKPLVPLLLIKIRYGKQVKLMYFPLLGHFFWTKLNEWQHRHPFNYIDIISQENPQLIAILTNLGIYPHILFCQTPQIRQVLQDHHQFKRLEFFPIDKLMDKSMAFISGRAWKKSSHRLSISTYFTHEQMMLRIESIRQITAQELAKVPLSTDFDALELATRITGEVIIRTFFGQSFGPSLINGKTASLEVQDVIAQLFELIKKPLFLIKFCFLKTKAIYWYPSKMEAQITHRFKLIREKASEIITLRIKQWQQQPNEQRVETNLLDVYLMDESFVGNDEQIEEMIQQFITFFFAGTDTTAHLVLFMLYNLSIYPELQEELREEIITFEQNSNMQTCLKSMEKLQAFINETLRINISGEMMIPRFSLQNYSFQNFPIYKGSYFNICLRFMATSPLNYCNPQKFNIRRWLDSSDKELNNDPLKFIPFSAFQRNCIGQHLAQLEAKVILCEILRAYRVIPTKRKVLFQQKIIMEFSDNNIVQFLKLSP